MNLVPLGKRVIIEKPQPPAENKTSAGLLLPDSAADVSNEGVVVALGEHVRSVLMGDIVIYPEYGAIELTEDGVDYLIVDEADLVAVRTPVKRLTKTGNKT